MKDLYKTLGVAESADDDDDQEGLPQAGQGVPPRRHRRRQEEDRALQGDQRGVRGAGRRAEAQGIRSPQARRRCAPDGMPEGLRRRRVRARVRRRARTARRRRVQRRLRRRRTSSPACSAAAAGPAATQSVGTRVRPRQSRGADMIGQLPVSFAEAALGTKRTIRTGSGATVEIASRRASSTAGVCASPARAAAAPSAGGAPGDLYLTSRCAPIRTCAAHGDDIELDLPVTSPRRCWAPRSRSRRWRGA